MVDEVDAVDQAGRDRNVDFGLRDYLGHRVVGWVEAGHFELVLDLVGELAHFLLLAVDEDHVFGLKVAQELHNALRVRMGRETHIVHLQLNVDHLVVNGDFLLSAEDFVSDGAWHAVARNDYCVFLKARPLLEGLQA